MKFFPFLFSNTCSWIWSPWADWSPLALFYQSDVLLVPVFFPFLTTPIQSVPFSFFICIPLSLYQSVKDNHLFDAVSRLVFVHSSYMAKQTILVFIIYLQVFSFSYILIFINLSMWTINSVCFLLNFISISFVCHCNSCCSYICRPIALGCVSACPKYLQYQSPFSMS